MLQTFFGWLFPRDPIPRARKAVVIVGAVVFMSVLGAVDVGTANSVEWSVAYAVCVALAAWYGGLWTGILVAMYAGVLSFSSAAFAGGPSAAGEELAALPIAIILAFFATSLVVMRRSLVEADRLASTDQLTGTANSRSFYRTVEAELARVRRYGGPFTLAYLDVDDFKGVNDRSGHAGGDELLRTLVREITADTRETDTFARMGGDEFVLLMPETGREAAAAVLEKLAARGKEALSSEGQVVGLSIGAVTFLAPPASADAVIREADEAMYAAKRSGRARAVLRVHPSGHGNASGDAGTDGSTQLEAGGGASL